MKIFSKNEYGTCKSAVIGRASNAVIPEGDIFFNRWITFNTSKTRPNPGAIPFDYIKQANDDLLIIKDTLEDYDIVVKRPEIIDHSATFADVRLSTGFNSYLARDHLLTIGDWAIECPTPFVSKHRETIAYNTIKQEAIQNGAKWITAPVPPMEPAECHPNTQGIKLTERYPIFKGSDILKFDDKILYAVSSTSNETGAKWLQKIVGTEFEVIMYNKIQPIHNLDYAIVPIGKDTLLLNVDRVSGESLPKFLKSYNKIWCHECKGGVYYRFPMASNWTGMNIFCIGEKRVIVDDLQEKLIAQLKDANVEVIQVPLSHAQTFGGGLHRIISDIERQ